MRLSLSLCLSLVVLCLPTTAQAEDEFQMVSAVWTDFVSALRRGDYRRAHNLFSAESRAAMPYPQFAAEYGPLSVAREMVLARPESMSTRVEGDWAEITYSGANPTGGQPFRIGAALVRNQGSWGLVAARNEEIERLEAAARDLLRQMGQWRRQNELAEKLVALSSTDANPMARFYRFEVAGATVGAQPLQTGLRAFYLDGLGTVRTGVVPTAPAGTAKLIDIAEKKIPAVDAPDSGMSAHKNEGQGGGMPEVTEPPSLPHPARAFSRDLDDMPEPMPPPPLEPPARPRPADEPPAIPEPTHVTLPDIIG